MHEYWRLDGVELARLVREKAVSADELRAAALARIEALNPHLNAVSCVAPQPATADGPYAGVPFLAKDVLPYPGLPATFGSRLFAGFVPPQHVPFTQRLAQSGLALLGKTTTSELGLLGSTEALVSGATRNPWGEGLSAGGSSGGSAAAVAAGLVPLAHASDGGGSIRLPAALNGVFGFKPSAGATVPATAAPNEYADLTADHCISRTVRDSATFLSVTARTPTEPVGPGLVPPLRIGVYTTDGFGRRASPEACAAVERAAALCESLGHRVEAIAPPAVAGEVASRAFFTIAGSAVAQLRDMMEPIFRRKLGDGDLEPFTWALLHWFESLPADALAQAKADVAAQGIALRSLLADVDVTLCPTVGGERLQLGELSPQLPRETLLRRTESLAAFTAFHNMAGAPAMSVPLGWTDEGLPVGCQFAASPGRDETLLRLAFQLEEAAPWADRWPTLAAERE